MAGQVAADGRRDRRGGDAEGVGALVRRFALPRWRCQPFRAPRRGINVGYTLSWLRQEENQYLACPPEVARELPENLARLAGYQRGAYALGYYGDLRDPYDAVRGEHAEGQQSFLPAS